jgi:hypothetical protein
MSATVIWRPEAHLAALRSAVRPAASDLARAARAQCSSRRVAPTISATVVGESATVGTRHPLGKILEEGAGPHVIEPKDGRVLRLADGRFVTGAVVHPGSPAQPFLRPSLPLWAGLYRRHAAAALRGIFGGL